MIRTLIFILALTLNICRFARFVAELVFLGLLLVISTNIFEDRLSKQLDNLDTTREEMVQNLANTAPKGR